MTEITLLRCLSFFMLGLLIGLQVGLYHYKAMCREMISITKAIRDIISVMNEKLKQ